MISRTGLVIGQLGFGGAERQLCLLARGLAGAGEQVVVFCLSEESAPFGEELESAGIRPRYIPRRGHREIGRVMALAGLLRLEGVDLVHSFLEVADIYTYLALPLARKPIFIPSVRALPARGKLLDRTLLGRSLRAGRFVAANCRASARAFAEKFRIDPERFRIINNGVRDKPVWSPGRREAARRTLNISGSGPVVGTVSKLTPDKNMPAFLKLAARLASHPGGLTALAAGSGLDRAFGEGFAESRTPGLRLDFLGPVREVDTLYEALDLFVLTSLREGLPNVALEAMAASLPVVAYNVGGLPEIVESGVTGYLVTPGDEEGLFLACRRLLEEPDLAETMGRAARERAAELFSVRSMVERTAALYREAREFPK